jgi:hypothetical protein
MDDSNKSNHNTTAYCAYWRTTTTITPVIIVVVLWLDLLLFSPVSKHNMWSYYDWVYCWCPSVNTTCGRIIILCLLTNDNNNKPNHNTTTHCAYWRTTTTINPVIIRPHIVFTNDYDWVYCFCSSVSKRNMWSYYDWVYCCCRPSVNTICG